MFRVIASVQFSQLVVPSLPKQERQPRSSRFAHIVYFTAACYILYVAQTPSCSIPVVPFSSVGEGMTTITCARVACTLRCAQISVSSPFTHLRRKTKNIHRHISPQRHHPSYMHSRPFAIPPRHKTKRLHGDM